MEVKPGHFHDAELKRISYVRDQKMLETELWHFDESTSRIDFADVHSFRISGDSGQNVVHSIRTSDEVENPKEDGLDRATMQSYVEWIGAESAPKYRDEVVERVVSGDLVLVIMRTP